MEKQHAQLVLGIDLGPNSLGWALVTQCEDGPGSIVATGVRVFQAGLDNLETDGKGKSRNEERRIARGIRRNLERRFRRKKKLAGTLQRAGMLPDGDLRDSLTRHQVLTDLDDTLESPYQLRARALTERLTLQELGRAIYHLAQRR
jgi:CRISPR-associated endonuclease Csn1